MDLYLFFVHAGFAILLSALVIVMFCSLLWVNAAVQKSEYLNAACGIVLLVVCLFLASLLAQLEREQDPVRGSSPTPAVTTSTVFDRRDEARVFCLSGRREDEKTASPACRQAGHSAGRFSVARG